MNRPLIGVSIGDPAGIGPEILLKAARNDFVRSACRLVAIGDIPVLKAAAEVVGTEMEIKETAAERLSEEDGTNHSLSVIDHRLITAAPDRGVVREEYGSASYEYIKTAISMAMSGDISAVVTNPINKAALAVAGVPFAGHTEMFAHHTDTENCAMMIAHGPLRAVHVSTHVSLREACDHVTENRVLEVIRLAAKAASRLDPAPGPVAVCGLNPHAGEGGLFGREEIDHIIPAIETALDEGIRVVGPLPPDTVFPRALGGEFAAIVAMYHDQGHIPLKTAGFRVSKETGVFEEVSGVNVTLGLPIIRTSVDHGTAFDLAGTGRASERSLVEAIEYAVRLAGIES